MIICIYEKIEFKEKKTSLIASTMQSLKFKQFVDPENLRLQKY